MILSKIDENISRFLDDWYNDVNQEAKSIFKIALTSKLLIKFYTDSSSSKINLVSNSKFHIFKSVKSIFNHLFWFLLWTIKWAIYSSTAKRSRVIITAIGSNYHSTQEYFERIIEIAKLNNCIVILLNLIESTSILKNKRLLYYPRIFYPLKKLLFRLDENTVRTEIFTDLEKTASKNNLEVKISSDYLKKSLRNLLHDYDSYVNLVEKIFSKDQIMALIQDYDYTYNKYLYWCISKKQGIKTIVIDTSLVLYKHLYKKTFSDYQMVWGEHKRDFLVRNNFMDLSKIIVTGRPISAKYKRIEKRNDKNLWIYISQAYSDPSFFISSRNSETFRFNLNRLLEYQKKNYPGDKFILKKHPADRTVNFDIKNSVDLPFNELIVNAKVIFVEDTTLLIELINEGYPLIYVLDSNGNDNIGLVNKGLIPGIDMKQNFENVIEEVILGKFTIDLKATKNAVKYYFGKYNSIEFKNTLSGLLSFDEK